MDDSIEQWKPIERFPGYQISNYGRVIGRRGQFLKCGLDTEGYPRCNFTLQKRKQVVCRVHTLVLEAFAGSAPIGYEACHGPHGKTCNHISNLSWGTRYQNAVVDRIRDGTFSLPPVMFGAQNPRSKAYKS